MKNTFSLRSPSFLTWATHFDPLLYGIANLLLEESIAVSQAYSTQHAIVLANGLDIKAEIGGDLSGTQRFSQIVFDEMHAALFPFRIQSNIIMKWQFIASNWCLNMECNLVGWPILVSGL